MKTLKQYQYIIGIVVLLVLIYWLMIKNKKPQKTWSMSNDIKIKELHPKIQFAVSALINRAETEIGVKLKINSGMRTDAQQKVINEAKGKWAAPAGLSYHNYGLAVDISVKDLNSVQLKQLVNISAGLGFEWGGNWKKTPEPWHFQITFGFKTSQLKKDRESGKFDVYPKL
jgi:LAS superfamily LD-carboxypeptidase LdcB